MSVKKWVMSVKKWVMSDEKMSDECEKMSDEWWMMKIEWPFFVGQTGSYCCNNGVDYLCPHWIPWWSHCLCLFQFSFRLCLVCIKTFPENIPFSGNAIFRKGKCFHVFGCISKKFPKNIFWCLENATRKRQTQKTRTKPRLTLDWVRRRGASQAPIRRPRRRSWSRKAPRCFMRSRSTLREIAIGAKARSSRGAIAQISAVYLIQSSLFWHVIHPAWQFMCFQFLPLSPFHFSYQIRISIKLSPLFLSHFNWVSFSLSLNAPLSQHPHLLCASPSTLLVTAASIPNLDILAPRKKKMEERKRNSPSETKPQTLTCMIPF